MDLGSVTNTSDACRNRYRGRIRATNEGHFVGIGLWLMCCGVSWTAVAPTTDFFDLLLLDAILYFGYLENSEMGRTYSCGRFSTFKEPRKLFPHPTIRFEIFTG